MYGICRSSPRDKADCIQGPKQQDESCRSAHSGMIKIRQKHGDKYARWFEYVGQ